MAEIPCDGCERMVFGVSPSTAIAAKGKGGKANASAVSAVGDGGLVAEELLGGTPIDESAWGGRWRSIEVVAAYPISEWNAALSRWDRVRTGTKTWTRAHSGDNVIALSASLTYSDTYAEVGMTLAEGEAIIPAHDDDPADYGEGNLSLLESSIDATGYVGRTELLVYVASMPSTWGTYAAALLACPSFDDYPVAAAGIVLQGGYDTETDHPYQVERMLVRWGGNVTGPDLGTIPGVGSPYVADPGLTIRAGYHRWTIDEASVDPEAETDLDDVIEDHPWRASLGDTGLWATYSDGADPTSPGWYQLGGLFDAAGLITMVEAYSWGLDLSPKW